MLNAERLMLNAGTEHRMLSAQDARSGQAYDNDYELLGKMRNA
jgi:hypothetical protein